MNVLEEFWYGNLDPAEYDANPSEEYKELIRLISRNEEKLLATMTDAQKDLFSRYQDCVREYQAMEIQYIRCGDYYIPDLKLPEENRPIGKWGRMHRDYLREHHPIQFNLLVLSGNFHTYLADLNEQSQERLDRIMQQMKEAEDVNEMLKAADPMAWVQRMNSIRNRAEEIILQELICGEAVL